MERGTEKGSASFKSLKYIRNCVCILLLCAVSFVGSVRSEADSAWDNPGFEVSHVFEMYNLNNDLPFSAFLTVTQTPDGYIYLGGYGGLLRFDGKAYEFVDGVNSASALYVDSEGNLWIGTKDSQIICMASDGTFTAYGSRGRLDFVSVYGITADKNGNIVFATDTGIFYIDTEGAVKRLDDDRLNKEYIGGLAADEDGNIYGVTDMGAAFVIRDLEVVYLFASQDSMRIYNCMAPDPERTGWVYIGTKGSEILHGSLDEGPETYEVMETTGIAGLNVIRYLDGIFWICAENGIGYIDENGYRTLSYKLSNEEDVFMDYEGNLWFVSTRIGALKISPSIFGDINKIYDLGDRVVNTTWIQDDLLYVGTDTGLIIVNSEGEEVHTPLYDMLKTTRIRAIKCDSKGSLWFCTFSEYGLVCLKPDGEIVNYTVEDGLLTNNVRTICERSDGSLVISVTGGIHILRDGKIIKAFDEVAGIPTSSILSLAEGPDGRLYLGTNGRGVYVMKGDLVVPYDGENRLDSGVIMGIRNDEERNCLWLVTGKSVGCIKDGKAFSLDQIPVGVRTGGCYEILIQENGKMMLLDGSGVYVVDGDKLLAGEDQDYEYYNVNNGVPHFATANSRNYISPSGVAYISCTDGITRIDPSVEVSSQEPRLTIAAIEVDGERQRVENGQTVRISSNAQRITVYPKVLSYTLANQEVSFKLEGFDSFAYASTKEDLTPLTYTNLKGGTYRFRLRTIGTQAGTEAFVIIEKEKAFFEYVLFWIGIALLFVLINIWLFRLFLKRQGEKLARKKEQERISGELDMAANIQAGVLPRTFPAFPDRKEFDIYASMTPAKEVAGDFYDFFLVDADHLAIVIADVSGKGVPAALFMMVTKNIIHYLTMGERNPEKVLEAANEDICASNNQAMFVTVWLGILEISTGDLVAANAGHEYPILKNAKGSFELLRDKHGFVVGGMEGIKYRSYRLHMDPGTVLFLYTDGIPEATNKSEELYGTDRLTDALNAQADHDPEAVIGGVIRSVNQFVGDAEQFDDMTMVCLEYKGAI